MHTVRTRCTCRAVGANTCSCAVDMSMDHAQLAENHGGPFNSARGMGGLYAHPRLHANWNDKAKLDEHRAVRCRPVAHHLHLFCWGQWRDAQAAWPDLFYDLLCAFTASAWMALIMASCV